MKAKAKRKCRAGRPTRARASAQALANVSEADLAALDPRRVLATIMADRSAPATARVNAAKALLADQPDDEKRGQEPANDPITTLALAMIARRTK